MTDINSSKSTFGVINRLIMRIIRDEGIKGLFRGVQMRCLYISIGGMIFFGTNEKIKKILNFKEK